MKRKLCWLLMLFACTYSVAKSQTLIPANTTVVQNFNAIGSSATAPVPGNWRLSAAGNGAASTWGGGTNIIATTQAANSGTPTNGGAYNWATTAGTDRAIGFMTAAAYAGPNSVMAFYRNNTGATVTSITVTFSIERYRINTGAFSLAFFSSSDGTAWTARNGGDISSAVFATGTSSYTFGTPQTVTKTVAITGISVTNGGDFYLRWVFNTTGTTTSQGLALDDVSVFAGTAAPVVTATLRDFLTGDVNGNGQPNAGDQLTYVATLKNTGSGTANNVNYTNTIPTNTTLAGSVRTSALARDDNYSTAFNTVLNGSTVFVNDFGLPSLSVASFGPPGNPSTVANGSNTAGTEAGGTVLMNTNGTFTYTPPAGFTGVDRFAYNASTGTAPDNMAIVTITVGTAAAAVNDTYSVIGNVSISPNAAAGVLANDPGDGKVILSVNGSAANIGVPVTTSQNGTLTVNADGSFTYDPPAGFEGTDNFTYSLDNGFSSTTTGTVTLNISGMIWFVNNTAGTNGNGKLSSPFNSLANFQAVNNGTGNNPAANDNIFLYESGTDYTGAVTLLNGQKLIGQDATATLATIAGVTEQAYTAALPAMNSANGTRTNISTSVAATNAINLSTGGSNTIRGFTIGNTTGAGVNGTGFGTLTVSEVTKNGTGNAIAVSGGALSGGFAGVTTSSSTTPISLTTITGTFSIATGSVTGATATSVLISGGTLTFTYSGSITQSTNAAMITVNGGHATGTVTFNTGTLSATNGTGLQFDNADGIYNFNGAVTLNGADAGVDITNGSGGNFSFANTAITNPSGAAFVVNGGNGTITQTTGTISKNNAGRLIDIQGRSGGSVSIGGNLSSTSASTGILVSNNTGGTITFSGSSKVINTGTNTPVTLATNTGAIINFTGGGLALTATTTTGFNVSGGGTVTVTGTGNTISVGAATALSVVGTNIGAANLNFQSIAANGAAANGIFLNATGASGGLVVTGTGSAGTGGTIQNCVQRGARFLNASNISLSWMNFTGNGTANIDPAATAGDALNGTNTNAAAGIDFQTVAGVTLSNVVINGGAQIGLNGRGVSNLVMTSCTVQNAGNEVLEDGLQMTNLSGTCSITNCSFLTNFHRQAEIQNSAGTLNLTISGCTFNRGTYVSTSGQGFLLAARGTGVITASVKSSLFQNNFGTAFTCQGIENGNVTITLGSSGTANIPAEGNTFTDNSLAFQMLTDNAAVLNFNIGNNIHTINPAVVTSDNTPFTVRKGTNATGFLGGTIGYNRIGNGTAGSGTNLSGTNGLSITNEGASGGMNISVRNNTFQNINQRGMELLLQFNDVVNINVLNNLFQLPNPIAGGRVGHAIFMQSGTDAADAGRLCADIRGNTIPAGVQWSDAAPGSVRVRMFPGGGADQFRISGLASGSAVDVVNYLNSVNTNAQASATTPTAYQTGAAPCF